jgi:uncharacterized membrane protein (Fun14 family)
MEKKNNEKWDLELKSTLIGLGGGLFLGFIIGMIYYQHIQIKYSK